LEPIFISWKDSFREYHIRSDTATEETKNFKNEKFKGFLPDAFLTLLSTGETMPVGQLENITEGVSAAVDTGGTASNSNCRAQFSEAVIDGETNPVGQSTSVSE